jgi:hypothetical protein
MTGFLLYLRNAADMISALLIADEVITSLLRKCGYLASQGAKPDLKGLAKWTGGGMSFRATGGRIRKGTTRILLDAGIYPLQHANRLQDIIEIDNSDGPTRIYIENYTKIVLPIPKHSLLGVGAF